MRLIFLISFLFSIIVSLNLYGNKFEYDKEVIAVFNQEYEICYYTIKKPEVLILYVLKKMKLVRIFYHLIN